jgi:hypothetical protein
MSANGDLIGLGILNGQNAATTKFIADRKGKPITTAVDSARLQIARAKAEGNAIDLGIQAALVTVQAGGPGDAISIVAAVAVLAGQPLCVHPTSGQLMQASAANFSSTNLAGLAQADTQATLAAPLTTQTLDLTDWSRITGAPLLAKGQRYYLASVPGTMALTPPTTPGLVLVVVGVALSATKFSFRPTVPILL